MHLIILLRRSLRHPILRTFCFLTSGVTLQACDVEGCSDADCATNVMAELSQELPVGEYRFEFSMPDGDTSCTVAFFEDGSLEQTGDDCSPHIFSRDRIEFGSDPETLGIKIVHLASDAEADQQYEPSYEKDYPNGEKCTPVCNVAEVAPLDTSDLVAAVDEYNDLHGLGGAGGGGGAG